MSVWVHALPSSHAEPLATTGLEQVPVRESQVPAAWHESSAVHVTRLAPAQVPAWQESVWVQASPSSHAVPSAFLEQAPPPPVDEVLAPPVPPVDEVLAPPVDEILAPLVLPLDEVLVPPVPPVDEVLVPPVLPVDEVLAPPVPPVDEVLVPLVDEVLAPPVPLVDEVLAPPVDEVLAPPALLVDEVPAPPVPPVDEVEELDSEGSAGALHRGSGPAGRGRARG